MQFTKHTCCHKHDDKILISPQARLWYVALNRKDVTFFKHNLLLSETESF